MTLGEQIRAAREGKNLSQEELAEYMGVSRQAVSKWENNTAVPHGANLERLAEFLGLELPRAEASPKKHNVFAWIGWGLAAVLLIFIVVTWIYQKEPVQDHSNMEPVAPQESTDTQPSLHSIRFYNEAQEEVDSENAVFPEYNAAKIDSILIQWTGNTPLRTVKMYFSASGSGIVQMELLEVSVPVDAGNALLLSAESLHRDDLEGYLYFELDFDGGDTITTYDPYNMDFIFFDDSVSTLAYIESFDGTQLVFDVVEWINIPSERAQELGIMDSGSGFYIYNESDTVEQCLVAENCVCSVFDWDEDGLLVPTAVSISELQSRLKEQTFPGPPYHLTIENNQIIEISEQYVP